MNFRVLVAIVLLIVGASIASAQVFTNGDFELPLNVGWNTSGDVRREPPGAGGNHYAVVTGAGQLWQSFDCGTFNQTDRCKATFRYFASPGAEYLITMSQGAAGYRSLQNIGTDWVTQWVDGPCGQVIFSVTVTRGVVAIDDITTQCVPEPTTLLAFGAGMAAILFRRRSHPA